MRAQRLDRVEIAGKLRLGHRGVNFVMADLMQQNRWAALSAAQSRDQVVQALFCVRWNRPFAQRANRIVTHA